MEDQQNRIPDLQLQPPTVDFIDNRLPSHHPMFVDPPVHYDPVAQYYVPDAQSLVLRSYALQRPSGSASQQEDTHDATEHVIDATGSSPRPTWTDVNAMQLWNELFPAALMRFMAITPEPKDQADPKYSIRGLPDWDAIHAKLLECQSTYQEQGGWFGKTRRKVADKMHPVTAGSRTFGAVMPDSVFSTPVVGVVQAILDATSAAATVRGQVARGFDELMSTFSDIENFLKMYPEDEGIRNASLDLIVVTLQAIERAIGFYISNSAVRAVKALGMGDQYGHKLVQSLDDIKTKSKRLLDEAQKAHFHASHTFSKDTRQFGQHIVDGQANLVAKVESLALGQAQTFNALESFLADHIEQRNHWLTSKEQYENSIKFLSIENLYLRSQSPIFQNNLLPPSHPPIRFGRDQLWNLMGGRDIDQVDLASVVDKAEQLPWRQRAQVEQIIQTKVFQQWMKSPFSTWLLIHWERQPPQKVGNVSPLSTFLASLTRMFRQNSTRFVAAVWFCGEHLGPEGIGSAPDATAMLASIIDQVLCQHQFDMSASPLEKGEISPEAWQAGDFSALSAVLEWLVRQLPETVTVVFLVDSVVSYEEGRETLQVLSFLLRLAWDQHLSLAVKVLFASTPGTNLVRAAFEGHQDSIVNIEVLPQMGWQPSEERMGRELGNMVSGGRDAFTEWAMRTTRLQNLSS